MKKGTEPDGLYYTIYSKDPDVFDDCSWSDFERVEMDAEADVIDALLEALTEAKSNAAPEFTDYGWVWIHVYTFSGFHVAGTSIYVAAADEKGSRALSVAWGKGETK